MQEALFCVGECKQRCARSGNNSCNAKYCGRENDYSTTKTTELMNSTKPIYEKVTLVDVQLASAYYPILVDLAKHKHCLTYGELVEQAKKTYPDRPVVQRAIAVSTGRRLDVVRRFTSERDLPDLSALIISQGTGECGSGFTRNFDPVAAREKVFGFDWSEVSTDFDGFVNHAEKAIKPRKKIKETAALTLMHQYFQLHQSI